MFGKDKDRNIRIAVVAVAALGAVVMAYLTRLHYIDASSPYCDFSEGFSCSIVNKSIYSEILGIPVAVLGLAYFLAVPYVLLNPRIGKPYRWILSFSVFSLAFGLYLSGIEQFVLGSVCIFCEISKVLMIGLIILAGIGVKARKEPFSVNWIATAVLSAAVFSAIAWNLQKDPVPDKDYAPLARCLTERGVFMYGAKHCPSCAKVKRDFGPAFGHISYLECDPRFGAEDVVERCIARDIKKTPTWLQETEDGSVLKEVVGAVPPEELAAEFGCKEAFL